MSVYVPLATKYRPQRFADVIGQDIAVRIITRGMQNDRLGAAMLFSGTRGIGKTTIARIIAKAFRCENRVDSEPCGVCEFCSSFGRGDQMDVIEIDAASNTGVDDVREIIESCRYRPTTGKYKIFIIDEVHMLSKSAFNALLKTLEEPPEHVKFLMATTETYKIPETILSRVLKFDLKRVDGQIISQYLSSICNRENIVASADALSLIAKASDGSIRDGLSILDQAINMASGNELMISDIREMLSFSDDSDIIDLLKLIMESSTKEAIIKYRKILADGASSGKIINVLMDCIHALTCIKINAELPEIASSNLAPKLKNIAKNVSLASLSRIWQMLIRGADEIKICDQPEITLEMIIVRVTYASGLPDLHEIIGNMSKKICEKEKTGHETVSNKIVAKSLSDGDNRKQVEHSEIRAGSLIEEAMKMFPDSKLG